MNSIERDLLNAFSYDKTTGILTRKSTYHKSLTGLPVGSLNNAGYLCFSRKGTIYSVDCVAILFTDGYLPKYVYHKNSTKTDNRRDNLIDITHLRKYKGEINSKYLNDILIYNQDTGSLTWRYNLGGPIVGGNIAGSLRTDGYLMVTIRGKTFLNHRLIWIMVHGYEPEQIDHINHDRSDNKLANLREVSNLVNAKNKSNVNKFGINGMLKLNSGNWNPIITVNYKTINLGTYKDFFEACCARKAAENRYNFHYNNGNTNNNNYYNSRKINA